MSGRTVTDKRIDAERRKANAICEQYYEKAFLSDWIPADWVKMISLEDELAIALKPRPLSSMQVRKAFHAYTVGFKRACNAGSTNTTHGTDAR